MLAAILASAALIGLQTDRSLVEQFAGLFEAANAALQVVFVCEISLKLLAEWPRPWQFFRDGWNVFDFTIVVLSLLPVAGPFANVARLARVLRVLRLVSAVPELRLMVATMLRSIPSLAHVSLLLGLVMYVYAVLGVFLFGNTDPTHWGSLGVAFRTTFQLLTLEGWVEMQNAVLPTHPYAWMFFGSFTVLAVFVVINLFIAVVLSNLEKAQSEVAEEETARDMTLLQEVTAIRKQLEDLEKRFRE